MRRFGASRGGGAAAEAEKIAGICAGAGAAGERIAGRAGCGRGIEEYGLRDSGERGVSEPARGRPGETGELPVFSGSGGALAADSGDGAEGDRARSASGLFFDEVGAGADGRGAGGGAAPSRACGGVHGRESSGWEGDWDRVRWERLRNGWSDMGRRSAGGGLRGFRAGGAFGICAAARRGGGGTRAVADGGELPGETFREGRGEAGIAVSGGD